MEAKKIVVGSPDRNRAIFDRLAKQHPDRWVQPSFIRVEQVIKNGRPNIEFSVVKDTNSDSVTERKIDRNDKFVITHMGILLCKRVVGLEGVEVLHTFPNLIEFADDAENFKGAHLESIYQGSLSVSVGQTKYLEALDTLRFRHVPDTQKSAATNHSTFDIETGLVEFTPQILLDGSQKNSIVVNCPFPAGAKVQNTIANTSNLLVLFCRGYLLTKR